MSKPALCKTNTVNSEIFMQILFSRKALKRHNCHIKNSGLRHDLMITVIDIVILLFREGFIFTKLCIWEVSQT